MRKDLGLAADAAASVGAALPTGSQALEVYNTMSDSEYVCCGRRWLVVAPCHGAHWLCWLRFAPKDFSSVYQYLDTLGKKE